MKIRMELTLERPRLEPRRRPRAVALAAVVLALILPGVALANHLFADVPTSSPYHANISNLATSGVTAGCGGSNFCPTANVTRQQMAAFLNRGLGRVAEAAVYNVITGPAITTVGQVTITPGIPGGAVNDARQFVRAQFNGTILFSNATGCPCVVGLQLLANSDEVSEFGVGLTATAANVYMPISTSGVIEVSGSSPVTVELVAYVTGTGSAMSYTAFGNLDATTFPFGGTGSNVLSQTRVPAVEDPLAPPSGD